MNKEEMLKNYLELLDARDEKACKDFVVEHFGVEGSEDFKEEDYKEFANAVVAAIIERNNAEKADEVTEAEVAEATEAAIEEVAQDEADA